MAPSSPSSASVRGRRAEAGAWTGDADLDVDALRPELVVAAVRRPGRIDAHVGEAIGDVRQMGVEERGEVHLGHWLRDAHLPRSACGVSS
jgi:hypothetical protein